MCCLSPCGNYVTCGSENGILHVWNVYKGNSVATYSPYKFESKCMPVHGIAFHLVENMMAFSHYGTNLPICMYIHEASVNESDHLVSKEEPNKNIAYGITNSQNVQNCNISFEDILCKIDQLIIPESASVNKKDG